MSPLPSGPVTFLFTDIENSTPLWEKHPEAMKSALAKHDSILKEAIESNHGHIIKTTGDGVHAVFEKAIDAIHATIAAQRGLKGMNALREGGRKKTETDLSFKIHPSSLSLSVRIGMHTGEAELRDGDYYGQTLNRAARIMCAGHGGQILVSDVTAQVAEEHLTDGVSFLDLGKHHLKGLLKPEHISQVIAPNLQRDFPPLKSITTKMDNLPAQLTSFIGRERELAEAKSRLEGGRLLTLIGPGGTGKTRLSIQLGSQLLSELKDGVWLVEFAPISNHFRISRAS